MVEKTKNSFKYEDVDISFNYDEIKEYINGLGNDNKKKYDFLIYALKEFNIENGGYYDILSGNFISDFQIYDTRKIVEEINYIFFLIEEENKDKPNNKSPKILWKSSKENLKKLFLKLRDFNYIDNDMDLNEMVNDHFRNKKGIK